MHIYLAEKKIPPSVVYAIKSDEDAAEKGYPAKPQEMWRPIIAIPKEQGDYTWIQQSCAIIEFLEDYCDLNPVISPVPSLRGSSNDVVRRSQIRGMMYWADEAFTLFGFTCMYGNQQFAEMFKLVESSQKVAKEMDENTRRRALNFLEQQGPWDFDAIASGKEGTVTIADIVMFASWKYAVTMYGKNYVKDFPNLSRFVEAFKNRPSAAREPTSPYPPGAEKIAGSWCDGVWE